MKLFFVTVPTLVNWYQSQNQLAAQGARTKASLEAAAAQQKTGIAANERAAERRYKQEQQLAQYKEKMERLREARASSAAEQQFLREQKADYAQARLGHGMDLEKTALEEQGRFQREQFKAQRQAPLDQAKIQNYQSQVQERQATRDPKIREAEAEANKAEMEARIMASPDLQAVKEDLLYFSEGEGAKYAKEQPDTYERKIKMLENQLLEANLDPYALPEFIQAESPIRKRRIEETRESLDTFGTEQRQAAIRNALLKLERAEEDMSTRGDRFPPEVKKRMRQQIEKYRGMLNAG